MYTKTQRKFMSDFPGKIAENSTPFFLTKHFFSNFPKKSRNFFEKFEKTFFTKKKRVRGKFSAIFLGKSYVLFRWVLTCFWKNFLIVTIISRGLAVAVVVGLPRPRSGYCALRNTDACPDKSICVFFFFQSKDECFNLLQFTDFTPQGYMLNCTYRSRALSEQL